MAQKENSNGFIGARISNKQYKIMLANATRPEERRAIKNLVLGEPVKVYTKDSEVDTNELKTDLIK
jgi:hypothetical protein